MSKVMRNVQVVQTTEYKKQPRRVRSPKHTFNLKARPFEITPFMIAPVLPGETLDSGFLQASVVSDKIANNLVGWWHEYHVFYVPIRALVSGEQQASSGLTPEMLNNLFLDPTYDITTDYGGMSANNVPYYSFKAGMDWVRLVYDFIVKQYFLDEGESATLWDDYAIAHIDQGNLFNSLKEETAGTDDAELPGVDEQEELDILPGFTTHYQQWEMMRDQGMTDLTYKDYLRSYGITPLSDIVIEETLAPEVVNIHE